MRYDLFISDFDGTLLRRDDRVSARTVAAIKKFTSSGGVFGVSTGRAFASMIKRLGELGLSGDFPVMCCQGAASVDIRSGKTLGVIPMKKAAVSEFLRRAETLGLCPQYYTPDKIFTEKLNAVNKPYFDINRVLPEEVGRVSEHAENCCGPVLKTLCFIEPDRRSEMLDAFGDIQGIKVFASHPMLIEAVDASAGKGNGLRRLCESLGIPIGRSVAAGDELNDMEMVQAAGLGVAMGNAVPELKAVADRITSDCDNDGVAEILEEITE